ncbi:MAG: hypothetical protein EOM20_07475 [Spartobacteria bacterium]|nr:hypothetical protein [Spartobacteria bacterium]
MKLRYVLLLLWPVCFLMLIGCEMPPPPEPASSSGYFSGPREVRPGKEAAVLYVRDHCAFVRRDNFAGGVVGYSNSVYGLAALLKDEGMHVDILPIEGCEATALRLAGYHMIFVIDTVVVEPQLQKALAEYVHSGGVLFGIGQIGRYDGAWQKEWPFGALFGLTTRVSDQWGTGVSWDGSRYQACDIVKDSEPLLAGLTNTINWGPHAITVYVTDVLDAEVLAQYPGYMDYTDPDAAVFVDTPIPALSIRTYGKGAAIYCAALPGDQKKDWATQAGDLGPLVKNAQTYVRDILVLPPDELVMTIGRNQVAWLPSGPKEVILRLQCDHLPDRIEGTYTLYNQNNRPVEHQALDVLSGALWNSRFIRIDLTSVIKPGSYKLEIKLPELEQQVMLSVLIADDFIEKIILPSQRHFLRNMRCGMSCHLQDPVTGGFHDATGDWSVRMWSMPHLVWGLTRYLEACPDDESIREELVWALAWCLQMQDEDGGVYAGVHPKGDMSPIEIRPEQDKTVREIEKRYSSEYTITYAAGLARAAPMLRKLNDPLAVRVRHAAEMAFERVGGDTQVSSKDIGNYAWAALELYKTTDDTMYLDIARTNINRLLPRQLPRGNVVEGDVYGDFFANERGDTFSPQQWKVFHAMGIYMSLIEYARIADGTHPMDVEVRQALDNFTEGYILGMSEQSPYKQMALGLEPVSPGQFKVYPFSHSDAWVRDHGLNCDMLLMATLALECNKDTPDPRLASMAVRQLNWLLGVNPLGYCMITGLGHSEPPLIGDRLGTGHIKGGIPNGIIGKGTKNLPAWGPSWDSREYWLPQNIYLLTTLGLLKENGFGARHKK